MKISLTQVRCDCQINGIINHDHETALGDSRQANRGNTKSSSGGHEVGTRHAAIAATNRKEPVCADSGAWPQHKRKTLIWQPRKRKWVTPNSPHQARRQRRCPCRPTSPSSASITRRVRVVSAIRFYSGAPPAAVNTVDLDEAWKVSKELATEICRTRPTEDFPVPYEILDSLAKRHVDIRMTETC